MREEKNKDKLTTNENCLLVVFDLENEITLPKADVVSFYLIRANCLRDKCLRISA